jgi:hypothetical protein
MRSTMDRDCGAWTHATQSTMSRARGHKPVSSLPVPRGWPKRMTRVWVQPGPIGPISNPLGPVRVESTLTGQR